MVASVGRLQPVKLREIWPHEEHDFTHWLETNIDVVDEVLRIGLTDPKREQAVGPFSVDLTAEREDGSLVIIENPRQGPDLCVEPRG